MKTAWPLVIGIAASLMLASPATMAGGLVLSPSEIDTSVRSRLEAGIARARHDHPAAFSAVRSLRGHRPEVYRQFRAQKPNVVPELRAVGPGAGWALIEAIAFRQVERAGATDREWRALRAGMLIALGDRRMPQAGPVFSEILASADQPAEILRAAAIGLGKLAGPQSRSTLIAHLQHAGPRRHAALDGLRFVRHPTVVQAVVPLLGAPHPATVRGAARTLGYVGSSWAWKTGNAGDPAHEMPIRTRCAEALLEAYLRYDEGVREQIARSLAMVDHPGVGGMIEARREGADEADRRALESLSRRLGHR